MSSLEEDSWLGDDGDLSNLFGDEAAPSTDLVLANPKAKAKPKTAYAIGLKKPTKLNSLQCRVCVLWFVVDDMALGATMDHSCKNKVDNIGRIAKSQVKIDWYKEVRANDIQLQQVVIEYKTRLGGEGSIKRSREV